MRFLPLLSLMVLATLGLRGETQTPSTARAATAEEVGMLNDILHKTADDLRRWAYTERQIVRDHKGNVKTDQLVRYDPSRPYPEQWTPLQIGGKEPSERDREKFRKRGEDAAKDPARNGVQVGSRRAKRVSLGEVLDVPRASIAAESGTHWTFDIPLLKVGNERFPPEKFQVHARVRKDGTLLENIAVKLRDSFRSKLVVKVKSGEGTIEFAQVDPKYPPTMVKIGGDASASILFVNVGGSIDVTRTELKHVRPFDERFEVQIGTLKAIDF
jgi:hypothetical protein